VILASDLTWSAQNWRRLIFYALILFATAGMAAGFRAGTANGVYRPGMSSISSYVLADTGVTR